MNKLNGFLTRLRRSFKRRDFDQQMDEEMNDFLDRETARRVAEGENPEAARRHAAIEFGHIDSYKEQVRDQRFGHWIEELWRNARFALRGLRKSPGFTVVAVATIAIAIGAGTAVFSLVNAILLQSLPVPNPQELRIVHWSASDMAMRSYNGDYSKDVGNRRIRESVNHQTFVVMRERASDMADVFGYFPAKSVTILTPNGATGTDGLVVSDNFFSGLGVTAHIGRVFRPGDETAARPEVIISHDFWQRHFGGDPAALGKPVSMLGTSFTIIGILPQKFPGIRPGAKYDFYAPLSAGSPFLYVPLTEDWHWFIRMMARLRPGHTDTELESALTPIFASADPERMNEGEILIEPGQGGLGFDRDLYGTPLRIMLGVTAMVMLIACANLAGLSLSRGASREHELAVRAALGAGRRRLITQSLTESVLLACVGGGLGIVLAVWGRDGLSRLLAGSTEGLRYNLTLDVSVLLFGLAAVALTTLLAGLVPAIRAGFVDPLDGLKARGAAGVPRVRFGRFLVTAQICVSLSILAAAGLGLRSLMKLRDIDPGFETDNLFLFSLNPSSAGYDARGLVDFHARTQNAINSIPGVAGTTVMSYPLLADLRSTGGFEFADKTLPPGERNWTRRQSVSDTFFNTMGIPILEGRGIAESDTLDSPKVVVVNETFARTVSPDRSPIGRTFNMWSADWRIVGICGDSRMAHLTEEIPSTTYFAFPQRFYDRFSLGQVNYAVRSALPAQTLQPTIEKAVASINPNVPVTRFTTQNALLNHNIGQERMLANLCTMLSGVALLLCCIGLYGLIAYDVTRRTGEIAIRMAIGARPGDVARPILRQALVLTATGIACGVPILFGLVQVIKSQLYGVDVFDPTTIVAVAATLLGVAFVAAFLPARRAARVDPINALRSE